MLKPLLPPEKGGPGRRRKCNRNMVNGMLWILQTGMPWRDLPKRYGSWKSVYTRYLRWSKNGVWQTVLDQFSEDADHGLVIIDGSYICAHQDTVGGKKTVQSALGALVEVVPPRFMHELIEKADQLASSSQPAKYTTSNTDPL